MIERFNDHAANERTYLSWVRTAIALMAFGFLIEKFDIFIRIMSKSVGIQTHLAMSHYAEIFGIFIMFIAVVIIIISSIRFAITRKHIASSETIEYRSRMPDLFLGILLVLITLFMLVYAWYTIF